MLTKRFFASAVVLLAFAGSLSAQAPAGATGKCKDGTYTTSATKKGACSKHGGVATWLAAAPGVRPSAPPAPAPAPPPASPKPKTPMAAGAPAGATALCTDGTYSMSQHRRGTCSKHKGVKTWLKEVPA